MKTLIMILILVFLNELSADNDRPNELQLGFYLASAISPAVKDAHGDHINFSGEYEDTEIGDININQNTVSGINARYYFSDYLGVVVDVMFATAKFPEQEVSLLGFEITQPKSDLEYNLLSLGPIGRYKGEGIWQNPNPYTSFEVSILNGTASDVNMYPDYGEGGSSSIDGTGFSFSIGSQYNLDIFVISVEYRCEYLDLEIDHFRSFEEGIRLTKYGSYICLIGSIRF